MKKFVCFFLCLLQVLPLYSSQNSIYSDPKDIPPIDLNDDMLKRAYGFSYQELMILFDEAGKFRRFSWDAILGLL